jgi:pyruvate,water dikinase
MPSTVVLGNALAGVARKLLGDLATAKELETALRALPNNSTIEMNRSLWELSFGIPSSLRPVFLESSPDRLVELYRNGEFPAEVLGKFTAFLERFGHRCASELDGGLPRWSENPVPVFSSIVNYLRTTEPERTGAALFQNNAELSQKMELELIRRARLRSALAGGLTSFCLRRARRLLGFRETPREYIGLLLGLARKILAPVGRRLADEGATELIRTGMTLRVDGSLGTVEIVSEDAKASNIEC